MSFQTTSDKSKIVWKIIDKRLKFSRLTNNQLVEMAKKVDREEFDIIASQNLVSPEPTMEDGRKLCDAGAKCLGDFNKMMAEKPSDENGCKNG